MSKKKKKKNNLTTISIVILITILITIIFLSNSNKGIDEVFDKEGYITEEESAFYKKVVTNNTLDDYYNDLANKRNSQYEEYYFSKDSNDFIELKMSYQKNVTTTLNITSDLKTLDINYNYELSYKDAHLMLEGTDSNDYTCNVILKEQVSDETINTYCDMIKDEIETFKTRRSDLMKNKRIQEIVKKDK